MKNSTECYCINLPAVIQGADELLGNIIRGSLGQNEVEVKIQAQCFETQLDLTLDPAYLERLSPKGQELAPEMTSNALGPILTALAAMFNAATTPQKMAVVALSLSIALNEAMPKLLRYLQLMDLGRETTDSIIQEILDSQAADEMPRNPDDPIEGAISGLNLEDL